MKYLKNFGEFKFSGEFLNESLESYAKKVILLLHSDVIRVISGDVNDREEKYNILARDFLFKTYYSIEKSKIPKDTNVPVINYAPKSEILTKFLKGFPENNIYNKIDQRNISGDKVDFAKHFEESSWLPKTVFSIKEALDGKVGFPVIAKVKSGHSGVGVGKFDSAKELKDSEDKFDLFCEFIDFVKEYRIMFVKDKILLVNERVPTIKDNSSIKTKEPDEKIRFVYVYQDMNKIPSEFIQKILKISAEIRKKLKLDLWSLDIVEDKKGKLWVMETNASTGLGSVKMCEVYRGVYEDFYGEKLPNEFLEKIYKDFVVPGHQNYYPKYKKEISRSEWTMDYEIITNPKHKDGYKYFFNLK